MTTKMNPEAKAKIVAALRSGKYKQGTSALHTYDCFCIWGVICDVSGVTEWSEPDTIGDRYYLGNDIRPPEAVLEWAGLPLQGDPFTQVTIQNEHDTLMGHNDSGTVTFDQLADAIEEQL